METPKIGGSKSFWSLVDQYAKGLDNQANAAAASPDARESTVAPPEPAYGQTFDIAPSPPSFAARAEPDGETPRDIATAPRDGTVILTDCGCVRRRRIYPSKDGEWVACDPSDYIFKCADNGVFTYEPKLWTPLPAWMK